jgi:signal recognition particle subunit SRP54
MFETLSDKLGSVFATLRRKGALSESDVLAAMREVRVALLEADVALPVVKDFVAKVTEKAVGQSVIKSVQPDQMVIKIVNDALVDMLRGDGAHSAELDLNVVPPAVYMMVGLQGSGKTTTTAKLAKRLTARHGKKILMASLDVNRPAAQDQLRILGEQVSVATLPIIAGQMPVDIAKRALQAAKLQGFDIVLLDTAGRLHVDTALMAELQAVNSISQAHEILLVVDSLTGQDAVNVAKTFSEQVPLTGVVLTRMDGDGRGGAALSMRAITGKPIKFIGTGEKLDAIDAFDPQRIAGRILGMGDVVALVERAAENVEIDEMEKLQKKMEQGKFDLDDMRVQFAQMKKMGGMKGLMSMMPGIGKMQKQMEQSGMDEKVINRMEAIILSMTPKERAKPEIINAKRKIRVAKGSGTTVQDVNKILKMHQDMATVMKKIKKMGGFGGLGALFGGGMPDPAALGSMLGGQGGMPGLGGSGLGGPKLPPGFNKFGKR